MVVKVSKLKHLILAELYGVNFTTFQWRERQGVTCVEAPSLLPTQDTACL